MRATRISLKRAPKHPTGRFWDLSDLADLARDGVLMGRGGFGDTRHMERFDVPGTNAEEEHRTCWWFLLKGRVW